MFNGNLSPEQWEYVGDCIYCGAACYAKDGMFKSTSNLPGCQCQVKGYGESEDEDDD